VSEQTRYLAVWLGMGVACALFWALVVWGFIWVTS
jgi:hypothetical protein